METEKKILLVEDDIFLREIYLDILKKEGYEVDFAINGREGLEKIKKGNWDLILLDITLPDISGLDVARQSKIFPSSSSNKSIVFLSNSDNDLEVEKAKKIGNGYLVKSNFTPDDLVRNIRRYLAS